MGIERTLVLIRERPMADVLDLTLVVVRKRPMTLGLAALAGIVPFVAFNAWFFDQVEDYGWSIPALFWIIEAPLATAPLTVVLGNLMFEQRSTMGRTILALLKGALPLLLIQCVMRPLPFFWIPPRLAFANEITLLERRSVWKIWRRGGELTSGREAELFLFGMAEIVAIFLFTVLIYVGTGRIFQAVLSEDMTWDYPVASSFASLRVQLPIWLGVAFFGIARFLTYIDQRVRLEGWEVELRLRAVGEALRESQRW